MKGRKKNNRIFIGSLSIISAFVLVATSISTSIFYQNLDSQRQINEITPTYWDIIVPDDYKTISQAIKNAEDYSKIYVRSGRYLIRNLFSDIINIETKGIYLQGENKDNTIISGRSISTPIVVRADDVKISGFTIVNNGENESLIEIRSDNCTLINNSLNVKNHLEGIEYAVKFSQSDHNSIYKNEIKDADKGFYLLGSNSNIIENNTFIDNNRAIEIGDVTVLDFNQRITQSLVKKISKNNQIINNTFRHNYRSIVIDSCDDNAVIGNTFYSNSNIGLIISYSKDIIIIKNSFYGCGIDIWGNDLSYYIHKIEDNYVNDKPVYYFQDKNDLSIPKDAGQIILVDCYRENINDIIISDTSTAILLAFCSRIIIKNCEIKNSYNGVYLHFCKNCRIERNNFIKNRIHASFIGQGLIEARSNNWKHNYWDNWIGNNHILFRLVKKRILGRFVLNRPFSIAKVGKIGIPIFDFDRFARSFPYKIES